MVLSIQGCEEGGLGTEEVLSIPVEGWWGWWRYYQFQWRDGGGAEEVLTIQVEEEVGLRSYYQYDIVIFSKVRYR